MPLAVLAALLMLAAPPAADAADVLETYRVPSVDGSLIHIEVARPDNAGKVPIILTYSPYNSISENGGNIADDSLYGTYGPKGYARAVADVIGTRNSTGCWDYGGRKETQSGVDVVNFLAKQGWSNGRVGMIGGSYEGTTANMVAAEGDKAPGLASIVPQAAISRWYGYAYQDGVRYLGNSEVPTDEGFDTPLAFDFGFGRTPPTKPSPESVAVLRARVNPCDAPQHTEKGYDRTPDYDQFWLDRDYLIRAKDVKVPSLVTHGWQDYNVKQSEGVDFYEALPKGGPFHKLFMWQGPHGAPDHAEYAKLLERFFARTLKGQANGIENEPAVWSEGRTGGDTIKLRNDASWPPPGTRSLSLDLGREGDGVLGKPSAGEDAFTDRANTSEEAVREQPTSERTWRYYLSEPLKEDVRIAGSPVLDTLLKSSAAHGQISPTLLDVDDDGNTTAITRGHRNLQYRDSLAKAVPTPVGTPFRALTRMAPQDQTVKKGHRIGVIVAGSNVVWAVPNDPNVTYTVMRGGQSRLLLPVVGPVPPDVIPGGRLGGAITGSDVRSITTAAPALPRRAPAGSTRRSRLSLHIWRLKRKRLRVYGRATRGARLTLRLSIRGRRTVVKRFRVRARGGAFRVTLRNVPRRAVAVSASVGSTKVTRRLAARQNGNRRS